MSDWKEPHNVAACARCGSGRVHPKLLVMGPIAGIDSDSRSYICEVCRHEGLPVIFDTEPQRAEFEREARGTPSPAPAQAPEEAISIPILPVDTEPLIDVKPLDLIPMKVATVVGVRWDGRTIIPTGYRVSFQEYWDAIGGPRYNASRVFMYDLGGINRANPNFDVMRHLVKRCDVWLDLGARETDELMDGYMLDVERVVAGSKNLPNLDAFVEAYGLSNEILPCIDWDGRVVWGDPRETRTDLREVARSLQAAGFRELCVMDLRRLGTELGPDPQLLESLGGVDAKIILGGGIRETDIAGLRERGFLGGLVDPFTPVIRSILQPPKDEGPAPASTPAPVARPAPSPRAVPDA
ncbi:MAG TPA: HisA/HisF-related TIM barrel protein [Thermoplasmata archaeon]|nr:HisA/HisF-related TIM barrel protein [Thermoplasmata archaeon]